MRNLDGKGQRKEDEMTNRAKRIVKFENLVGSAEFYGTLTDSLRNYSNEIVLEAKNQHR